MNELDASALAGRSAVRARMAARDRASEGCRDVDDFAIGLPFMGAGFAVLPDSDGRGTFPGGKGEHPGCRAADLVPSGSCHIGRTPIFMV
jgi:hypothetical protein